MTYIGFFRHGTSIPLERGPITHSVTPISFTVTIDADTLEEAVDVFTNHRVNPNNVSGYDGEFEDLIYEWDYYSLEAVIESLY